MNGFLYDFDFRFFTLLKKIYSELLKKTYLKNSLNKSVSLIISNLFFNGKVS